MKNILILAICLFLTIEMHAQGLVFNKKEGTYKNGDVLIANLIDIKIKGQGYKNYALLNPQNDTLIKFEFDKMPDILGGQDLQFYRGYIVKDKIAFTRPLFTGMLNTFREVGEELLAAQLFDNTGGWLSTNAMNYAQQKNLPIEDNWMHKQDSIKAQLNTQTELVERNKNKAITVNYLGKIGQGDVVIGYWEKISVKNGISEMLFLFRNIKGQIVAASWVNISTIPNAYIFVNGERKKDDDRAFSFPFGGAPEAYAQAVAAHLVHLKLL